MVQSAAPSPHYRMVHFDVSGVDLTNSTLVKAEFRIFRAPNPQARATEQRVEIYQVTQSGNHEKLSQLCFISFTLHFISVCKVLRPDEDSTSTQRYIDSRTVQLKSKGGWISVELTETIKDWVSDQGQNSLLATLLVNLTSISLIATLYLCWAENNLGLKLGVHCPCCTFVPSTNNIVPNKSEELEALFSGLYFLFSSEVSKI